MIPELLSPLQQEFKSWHDNLFHLHTKSMFTLAKPEFLQSRCLNLKDDVPLCASYMFGTENIRQHGTKSKK